MQKGIGTIKILVILALLILAGSVGYVYYGQQQKNAGPQPLKPGRQTFVPQPPLLPPQPQSKQNAKEVGPIEIEPEASLPTTCTDQLEGTPVITSLSNYSGPVGTKLEIRGCNFSGFEGDLDAVFLRNDGAEIPLYGGTWQPGYGGAERGKIIIITVQSYCPSGSEMGRYSGITSACKTVEATPGIYKVYVTAWGKKSNEASFTIK